MIETFIEVFVPIVGLIIVLRREKSDARLLKQMKKERDQQIQNLIDVSKIALDHANAARATSEELTNTLSRHLRFQERLIWTIFVVVSLGILLHHT